MPVHVPRRQHGGFIPFAILAAILAAGSSVFAVLDWRENQKQQQETQRIEDAHGAHLKSLDAKMAELQHELEKMRAAEPAPKGPPPQPSGDTKAGRSPKREVERQKTPGAQRLKERINEEGDEAEGKDVKKE
jgi:hypothetical protein